MELCQWQRGRVQLLEREAGGAPVAPRPLRRASTSMRRATVVLGSQRRSPGANRRTGDAQEQVAVDVKDAPTCGICFDAARDPLVLEHCRHAYCRACLGAYLRLKILRGSVYPLCCRDVADHARNAAAAICGREIAPADVARAVPPDVWRKYQRFKLQRDHRGARECPHCAHMQVFPQASAAKPTCVCGACGRAFCFVHSAAHAPDEACAHFERAHAAAEAPSRAEVARIAKPCPSCGSDIEKAGGCDHMCCTACAATFCWICGAALRDGAAMRTHQCLAAADERSAGRGARLGGWEWAMALLAVLLSPLLLLVGAVYALGWLVLQAERAIKRRAVGADQAPSYL